ncbi:MAG: nitrilase-related carbon-nitrogen hydrolase [Pseudomonadota bacterium]
MRDLRVATVCMHSEIGEIEKNLVRTASFASKASGMGADLICFPELSITGYTLQNPMQLFTDLMPDRIIDQITGMAIEKRMIIIAGTIELSEGEKPYISQIVAGPEGLMGLYRKTHLSPAEKEVYRAGQSFHTFCYGDIVFGIQLCYESHFPEISTLLALRGAQIIFIPHASPRGTSKEKVQSWLRHLPARAFDNTLFIVACNQVGKNRAGLSFPGAAIVLDPSGKIIARHEKNQENMIITNLKMDEIREKREHRMKFFLPNRRPELYNDLSTSNV